MSLQFDAVVEAILCRFYSKTGGDVKPHEDDHVRPRLKTEALHFCVSAKQQLKLKEDSMPKVSLLLEEETQTSS